MASARPEPLGAASTVPGPAPLAATVTPAPWPANEGLPSAWPRVVRAYLDDGSTRDVPAGTPFGSLVPAAVKGVRVVAALFEHRPASLSAPIVADGRVGVLLADHWEGERIRRRSLGLALVQAAAQIEPAMNLRLGPSLGFGHPIFLSPGVDLDAAASLLQGALEATVRAARPFREEWWTVDEARVKLERQGWGSACSMLAFSREAMIQLGSCGDLYALALGPYLPTTAWLDPFSIGVRGGDLFLLLRDEAAPASTRPRASTRELLSFAPSKRATNMSEQHRRWLGKLGVDGVGALNRLAVGGAIGDLIEVSEGFHEKRAADIAAEITERAVPVRVIAIAGPSAAGKTTFIRRLTTQLRVLGFTPRILSLDDYYLDRDRTPRDEQAEYDFEAFDALDGPLLQGHLAQLLEGHPVRTARFDFESGRSDRQGGPELQLLSGDVLLVEGLHGLNPRLFAGLLDEASTFRVFVNVETALAFDEISHVNTSDIRLVRRLVRDRRRRAISASENIRRWPSVRRGEKRHIFPHLANADAVFDSSLVYEPCVLKVFAERYLLEVSRSDPSYVSAHRLRQFLDQFVSIAPDHVPPNSLLREFIG